MEPVRCLYPFNRLWPLDQAVVLASLFEATAPKLGNVHPGAAFSDMNYSHFINSADSIGPVFDFADKTSEITVGALILESVTATQQRTGLNTNLGTLLLFGPLATAYIRSQPQNREQWREAVTRELAQLTPADSQAIYAAIRIAKPGGLGTTDKHDLQHSAPSCLVSAMREVAKIDAVARQYTNNFADIFERMLPWLDAELLVVKDVFSAICDLQLRWLAHEPDGLIVRKAGLPIAYEVQALAKEVWQENDPILRQLKKNSLDDYLRSDGHRRNPGTTADLIAATLLVQLMCWRL